MANRAGGASSAVGSAAAVALIAVSIAKVATDSPTSTSPVVKSRTPQREVATAKTGVLGKIDLAQQRRTPTAFGVGVIRKFTDDRAGRLAALVAYYGFFSIFPALLALVTVLGFVLEGNASLRRDIADSALSQFPVIGEQIGLAVSSPLGGSPIALAVGIAGALWAGMGAMQAAQDAMNDIWDVARADYPTFIAKRVRSLLMLLTIGILLIGSTVVAQLAAAVLGIAATLALFAVTLALNVLVFLVAFKLLTVADVTWRRQLPGAIVAGVSYTVLQLLGNLFVTRTLQGAEDTYGTFAVVIGLLSWIFLLAQMTMVSAEVNVVLARRLWPRSLFRDPATVSDQRSSRAQVEAERMDDEMDVDVEFDRAAVR